MKNKYLEVVYNLKDKPITDYPKKLAKYLVKSYKINENDKFLELGCGRGDFINEFTNLNLNTYAVDNNNFYKENINTQNFFNVDLEKNDLPFSNDFFDVVYSKSFIEHFYYPEKIFVEAHRVLKNRGKFINLTPDWEIIFKEFYDDYTHRTPFTVNSLKEIYLINGFQNVKVKKFKQLPSLWNNNFFLKIFSEFTRHFMPKDLKNKSKWIRFSKEIMLIGYGEK